jgi:hypothetical protein
MGDLSATIYERDFTGTHHPSLTYRVERYSRAAIGGCKAATIIVTGPERDVFDCIRWLRRAVAIDHTRLGRVWWGYVADIDVELRNKTVSTSIDWLYNRIKVVYSNDGESAETAWGQDAVSVATYGAKENVLSIDETTATGALAERDRALAMTKAPQPRLALRGSGLGDGTARAVLRCRGWYSTLVWQRLDLDFGTEKYDDEPDPPYWQVFGYKDAPGVNYVTYVAQSIQLLDTVSWNVETLEIVAAKAGSPEDIIVDLCANAAGVPGAILDTCTFAAADFPAYPSFGWAKATWTNKYEVQPGVIYHLRAKKNGANDFDNNYRLRGNHKLGYPRGSAQDNYNGTWRPVSGGGTGNFDVNFRLVGTWPSTRTVDYMLATIAPQFITGADVTGTAGATGIPTRSGNTTIAAELETLLKQGTSDSRRFLISIDAQRLAHVYPEPLKTEIAYYVGYSNELLDAGQQRLDWALCPAGVWIKAMGVPPEDEVLSVYEDPGTQFIEECEYTASSPDQPSLTIRGTPSPFGGD